MCVCVVHVRKNAGTAMLYSSEVVGHSSIAPIARARVPSRVAVAVLSKDDDDGHDKVRRVWNSAT